MKKNSMSIVSLSTALAAEVHGIDLSKNITTAEITSLNEAFHNYQVLVFRDQQLQPNDLIRIGNYFGTIARYPFVKGMEDYPDIIEVIKKEDEVINFGGLWHTDTSYLTCPPKASLLYARMVPNIGGDTLFANMYGAYEQLSATLKTALCNLKGVNQSIRLAAAITRVHRIAENPASAATSSLQAIHPLIRTHPETGRKALYCSDAHTAYIDGMSVAESSPLLNYLYQQQQLNELTYRLQWQNGTLVIWDNRCIQHNAINDYHGSRREMLRVTLAGDKPF